MVLITFPSKEYGIGGVAISLGGGGISFKITILEFGEELLSGLGGGAFIGIGFMIYRFFKVSWSIAP